MNSVISSDFDIYGLVILPTLIFIAKVFDVSFGTIRIIFISKGLRYLAPLIGFFEVSIWLLAISQIMQNLSNFYYYFFYAGGFATGVFVGMFIEDKLSIGTVIIRIITKRDTTALIRTLQSLQYRITVIDANSDDEKVKIIFSIIPRRDITEVIEIVKQFNPRAFYSIEDVKSISERLPTHHRFNTMRKNHFLKFRRKAK